MLAALSLKEIDLFAAGQQIKTTGAPVADDDETYWSNVRQLFPLSKDMIYLNNGTFGPSPYPVIDVARSSMMDADQMGNYGSYDKIPPKIAKFVGANDDEIALTHNVTEGINVACWGLPLKKGDEVILTTHEHVGNAIPWLNRQRLHGIVIKKFTPAATAAETLERISALITSKTRAIACPHIPCTNGQVLPIKEICTLAREKRMYSVIDGAHGPGMYQLDLHDMGCDTYATCSHKWMLGPKGTGFLYVRKDFQDTLQAYNMGAGGDTGWDMLATPPTMSGYAGSAHRYYGGTQANGLYAGVGACIDFIETIGMANIHNRIKSLGKYTQDRLMEFEGKVELLTPTEERSRCAVNSFRIKGVDYNDFFLKCAENKIRIRSVPENNLNCSRISTHIYNNKQEIDQMIDVLKKVV